jgi:hypothetical protein
VTSSSDKNTRTQHGPINALDRRSARLCLHSLPHHHQLFRPQTLPRVRETKWLRRTAGCHSAVPRWLENAVAISVREHQLHRQHYSYHASVYSLRVCTDVRRKPAKTFWTTSLRRTLLDITQSEKRWVGCEDNSLEHRLTSC